MTIMAWAIIIILALIFIFVGLALVMFFTFFFNDGTSPGLGVAIILLIALALAIILPHYNATPVIPASIIALSILVAMLGTVAHFLLPHLDNKDLRIAFRPLIIFTIISGILIAAINLAKALVA